MHRCLTEPTTPPIPNGEPRDRVGSSGFPHPEETVSPLLLHPRRPREEQKGKESGNDRRWRCARLQQDEEARDCVSQAAQGGPKYGPVARVAMGGEGPRELNHDGAEDGGVEPGSRQPHLRSRSGPGRQGRRHPCAP